MKQLCAFELNPLNLSFLWLFSATNSTGTINTLWGGFFASASVINVMTRIECTLQVPIQKYTQATGKCYPQRHPLHLLTFCMFHLLIIRKIYFTNRKWNIKTSKDEEADIVDSSFLWLVCTSELVLASYVSSVESGTGGVTDRWIDGRKISFFAILQFDFRFFLTPRISTTEILRALGRSQNAYCHGAIKSGP